jgi:hypothetical protein
MGDNLSNGDERAAYIINRGQEISYNLRLAKLLEGTIDPLTNEGMDYLFGKAQASLFAPGSYGSEAYFSLEAVKGTKEINALAHDVTYKMRYRNQLAVSIEELNQDRPAGLPPLSEQAEREREELTSKLQARLDEIDIAINDELKKLGKWLSPEQIAAYRRDLSELAHNGLINPDEVIVPSLDFFDPDLNTPSVNNVGVNIQKQVKDLYLGVVGSEFAGVINSLNNDANLLSSSRNSTGQRSQITENFNRVAGMLSPEEFANYKAGFLNHHDLIQGVDGNFKINPDAKVAQEGDFVVKPEFFAPGNQLKPSGM